jgi:DNA-binding HxlR family transcriptional regulator
VNHRERPAKSPSPQRGRQADGAARRYEDACGTAHGLDLIGDRWALLVLRELMLGPRRFSQLRNDLIGLSANVLTQRLAELEGRGLLRRALLPPPASVPVYELTPWGREAETIVVALGRWAARSPWHDPSLPISAVSLMLSLRATFDAVRAGDKKASATLAMGDDVFSMTLERGELRMERGTDVDAQVRFTGTPRQLAALLHGMVPWSTVEEAGEVLVEGDLRLARRLSAMFPLPDKADAASAPRR